MRPSRLWKSRGLCSLGLDSRCLALGFRLLVLGSGCWLLVPGSRFLEHDFRFLVSGFWFLVSAVWILGSVSWNRIFGSWLLILVAGFWNTISGAWFMEHGFRFLKYDFWCAVVEWSVACWCRPLCFCRFVKFTARANVPYSALRGRLPRAVKPNWPHRATFKKLIR